MPKIVLYSSLGLPSDGSPPRRNIRVFYRETGAPREGEAPKPAVVFIHGLLDHRSSGR